MSGRIITRNVWYLSLVSLFADVASELLYPVVPVYLKSIGFSMFLIGLLEGIAEAVAGMSKGYFGQWSDRRDSRLPFVRVGYLLSALAKPMMVASVQPVMVFFARTIDRFGKGIRTAPRDALLAAESGKEHKARVFGFHRGMDTLGAVIGPLLALVFLSVFPGAYVSLFLLATIPGLIAVAFTFGVKEKKLAEKTDPRPGFFEYFKYWRQSPPAFRKLMFPMIFFALFNSSDMLLILRMRDLTGSDQTAIMAYILYNLVYALASYPLGSLADKIGLKAVFSAGLLVFASVYAGMSIGGGLVHGFVMFGIYGLYMAATEGVSKAWVSKVVPQNETATAIGLFSAMQSLALMLASSIAGAVWAVYGAGAAFMLTAAASVMAFLWMLFSVSEPKVDQNRIF
ncbi:MAG TPA: MFS transporter [Bacteroidales bacterium]|nr:MFS transporter [Bacteroidales bacterium]